MKYKVNDRVLRRIARQFVAGIMEGSNSKDMCFVVCNPLTAYLNFLGIECELTEGEIFNDQGKWHHYWVTLPDGRVIDPTADQFIKPNGKRLKNLWVEIAPENYQPIKKPCLIKTK